MSVVPDGFECAQKRLFPIRHIRHISTSLATELARADVDDRRAEAGGLNDPAGGIPDEHGSVAQESEKLDALEIAVDLKPRIFYMLSPASCDPARAGIVVGVD